MLRRAIGASTFVLLKPVTLFTKRAGKTKGGVMSAIDKSTTTIAMKRMDKAAIASATVKNAAARKDDESLAASVDLAAGGASVTAKNTTKTEADSPGTRLEPLADITARSSEASRAAITVAPSDDALAVATPAIPAAKPGHDVQAATTAEDAEETARRYLETNFSSAMAADWTQRATPRVNAVEDLLKFMPALFVDVLAKCPNNPDAKAHFREFTDRRGEYNWSNIDAAGVLDFLRASVKMQSCELRETVLWRSRLVGKARVNVLVFSFTTTAANGENITKQATVVFESDTVKSAFLARKKEADASATWVLLDVHRELSAALASGRVLIAGGESGSGKTLTSMLLAAEADRDGSATQLALYVMCKTSAVGKDGKTLVQGWEAKLQAAQDTANRDSMAVDLISAHVEAMTRGLVHGVSEAPWPEDESATFGKGRRVVLIIDEAGAYPTLVRAVCSAREQLRERVRLALKLPTTISVTIVVAGTGVEGTSRQPGSLPETHTVFTFESQVASAVWESLSSRNEVKPFAERMEHFAINGNVACLDALDMVRSNARAAAIFATCVSHLPVALRTLDFAEFNVSALVRFVTLNTAITYKSMNGLAALTPLLYSSAFFRAVAMTRHDAASAMGPAAATDLECRFGMITDRASALRSVDVDKSTHDEIRSLGDGHVLVLSKHCHKQRYLLSRAQIVMAQTQLGIGGRPTSGEGFELVVADYALCALLEVIATGNDQGPLLALPPSVAMPSGWSHVSSLFRLFRQADVAVAPVKVLQLHHAMAPDQTSWQDEVRRLFAADASLATSHLVVINGEKAAYGDLLIIVRHKDPTKVSMFVVQCKRYLKKVLSVDDVVAELVKMGFGDAADQRNAFVHRLPNKPDDDSKHAAWMEQVKKRIASEGPAAAPLAEELTEALCNKAWRVALKALLATAGDWPLRAEFRAAQFWQHQLGERGGTKMTCDACAVVVCYGMPPETLPAALGGKGQFLYVPCASGTPTADLPPCLHEMYPLTIERQALGVVASAQVA